MRSQLQCIVQNMQKIGHKCRKCSTTNMGICYITHAACTFKITCNAWARNNFQFTFQQFNTLALGGFGDFRIKNNSFRLPYQRPSSSADCARELFNGSNGLASLVDCTRKKIFWLGVSWQLNRYPGCAPDLEAFLYPIVHEIFVFGLLSSYRYQPCQVACMWSDVIVL